jgi:hypothetical protein
MPPKEWRRRWRTVRRSGKPVHHTLANHWAVIEMLAERMKELALTRSIRRCARCPNTASGIGVVALRGARPSASTDYPQGA